MAKSSGHETSQQNVKERIVRISQRGHQTVQEFVQATTFHGFEQVASLNKFAIPIHFELFQPKACWVTMFWSVVMLCMFVIAFLQLMSLLEYFIQNPTLSTWNIHFPDDGLEFPTFTLCILSKLNITAVAEKYPKMNRSLAEYSTTSFISAYSMALMDYSYFLRNGWDTDEHERDFEDALDGKNLSTFFDESAFQCKDQFLFCWFQNGYIFDCCRRNYMITVKRHLIHSGVCFEFDATDVKQRLPGPVGGFGFAYWYPNKHIIPTAFNSYAEHALHLYMSSADAMLEKHHIVLPIGYHNHISLSASHVRRMQRDQFGRRICKIPELKYFDNYTFAQCQVECLIDAMLLRCNCTGMATVGKIPQDKICKPREAMDCYNRLMFRATDFLVECRQRQCKEACDYWTYTASLSVGKVFNPVLAEQMLQYWRLPEGDPSQSLIIGDVYFDQIQYLDMEQNSAFNIETFVSSIGGAMGLWTGASIITWIHLCFFCCSIICRCRKKKELDAVAEETLITTVISEL